MSCRLLTRSHLASFLQTRTIYLRRYPARSRRPSSLHAVKLLYTVRHPRGSRQVTGHPVTPRSARADSEYRWPTWLRPTRIRSPVTSLPVLGSGHSDTGRTHGSGRLGSQRPVTSHDADHSNTAGTGIHPARARARPRGTSPIVQKSHAEDPAGNRRSSSRLLRQGLRWSTSQALRSADPGAQLHRAWVEHNGARCLAHSAVLSEDLLGSNPIGIAPLRIHILAAALAHQRTYSSHVRRRKFSNTLKVLKDIFF